MRDVDNFEGKIMDTYYETQLKRKDPYIKFWMKNQWWGLLQTEDRALCLLARNDCQKTESAESFPKAVSYTHLTLPTTPYV